MTNLWRCFFFFPLNNLDNFILFVYYENDVVHHIMVDFFACDGDFFKLLNFGSYTKNDSTKCFLDSTINTKPGNRFNKLSGSDRIQQRNDNTKWHHKAMTSNRILDFHSTHPENMKMNVAKGCYHQMVVDRSTATDINTKTKAMKRRVRICWHLIHFRRFRHIETSAKKASTASDICFQSGQQSVSIVHRYERNCGHWTTVERGMQYTAFYCCPLSTIV